MCVRGVAEATPKRGRRGEAWGPQPTSARVWGPQWTNPCGRPPGSACFPFPRSTVAAAASWSAAMAARFGAPGVQPRCQQGPPPDSTPSGQAESEVIRDWPLRCSGPSGQPVQARCLAASVGGEPGSRPRHQRPPARVASGATAVHDGAARFEDRRRKWAIAGSFAFGNEP